MRYERKYRLQGWTVVQAKNWIRQHSWGFDVAYPERWVNNLYFDTPERDCLQANLDGNRQREKFRMRWYGAFSGFQAPLICEIKGKAGELGYKESRRLDTDLRLERSSAFLAFGPVRRAFHAMGGQSAHLDPVLWNRYLRSYFQSRDGHFRLTLDRELRFAPALQTTLPQATAFLNRSVLVLELKYHASREPVPDGFTEGLPFRLSRQSKYVEGMLAAGT